MPGEGVVSAVRVKEMAPALAFYLGKLGFTLERGGPLDDNCAIALRDARLMLETAGNMYSDAYNEAIRNRLGSPSSKALYIEAPDLGALYDRVKAAGVPVLDPLAARPWGQAEFTVEDPDGTWLTFWRGTGDS